MWEQLLRNGTPRELALAAFVVAAMSLLVMVPFVWVGGRIIALKERPERRALWTVSVAYIGAALLCIFGADDAISPWFGPILPLPGAAVVFLWLRHTYRKSWIDDDAVPEGTTLANSNWRIGVGVVVSAIIAAAIKAAARMASHP